MRAYLAWKRNALITDYKHILEEKDCYGKFAWRNERLSLWISYRLYYLLMTKSFCFLVLTQASLWPLFLPAWGGLCTHEDHIKLRTSLIETDATDDKYQQPLDQETKPSPWIQSHINRTMPEVSNFTQLVIISQINYKSLFMWNVNSNHVTLFFQQRLRNPSQRDEKKRRLTTLQMCTVCLALTRLWLRWMKLQSPLPLTSLAKFQNGSAEISWEMDQESLRLETKGEYSASLKGW